MKRILYGILGFFLIAGFCAWAAEKIQVAVIVGGHDFDKEFWTLFESEAFQVTKFEHPKANEIYTNGKALEFDVIVFYDMWQEIDEKQQEGLLQYVKSGKGLVVLHHALASYQQWPAYRDLAGGQYLLNQDGMEIGGKKYPGSNYKHDEKIPVDVVDSGHPITQGLPASFELLDEWYGKVYIHPDVHPLLKTSHPDSMPILAWTKKYEGQEVCLIQCGHDKHSFENAHYRKLIHNAIVWAAKKK